MYGLKPVPFKLKPYPESWANSQRELQRAEFSVAKIRLRERKIADK
jgi:hypothetical protein